ncbi:MAG: cell wall-binding repeat-containing protein, partial [Clostridioides sp.]|nr:cell wall-binding repeat-containing protein [Clostridioides sp.]
NTFYKNKAADDAGAMLIQVEKGICEGSVSVKNNTFYENEANGLQGNDYSVGGVQLYATPKDTKNQDENEAYFDFENNTFYKNKSSNLGGAISTVGINNNKAILKCKNNIIVGNISSESKDKDENYKNVVESKISYDENGKLIGSSLETNQEKNLGGNIGFDNGSKTNATNEETYGKYDFDSIENLTNYSDIKVGYSDDKENQIVVPTLPIKPEGITDQTAKEDALNTDQRNFLRNIYKSDIGSVEISWIKYDANGGEFELPNLQNIDGTKYYEGENNKENNIKTDKYYDISYNNMKGQVKSKNDLNVSNGNKEFLGWSENKNENPNNFNSEKENNYVEKEDIDFIDSNRTLYAVWKIGGSTPDKPSLPDEGVEGNEAKTVIMANGERYTDVLTASVLANEKLAPVLLTNLDSVDDTTMNELRKIMPDEIIISGGPEAVSEKVKVQLEKEFKVRRIWGKDRYGTAVEIGKEVRAITNNTDSAMLVVGTNFPDAMSISSLASYKRTPILLTQTDNLNTDTEKVIKDWKIQNMTIGGKEQAVSQNVENDIKNKSKEINIERIGGIDRYETARLIGEKLRTLTENKTDAVLVDGTKFPDALTVNSLAGYYKKPILLTEEDKLNEITSKAFKDWSIKNVLIAGGYQAVAKEIENEIKSLSNEVELERLAGKDRYETAVKICEKYTSLVWK